MLCVSSAKMWLWSVLWRTTTFLVVAGTFDINFLTLNRRYVPTSQINCYEYPKINTDRFGRAYNEEWRSQKTALRNIVAGPFSSSYFPIKRLNSNRIVTRRYDDLLVKHESFKEHAKLVQDINSLKQVVFVAPLLDDSRDYDESIFHDIIETFTTTPKPTTTKVTRPQKPSSIPIILLGGASTRQIVKSQPLTFPKSTINLVGSTISPLMRHPYPFVMQGVPQKPLRVCMPTMALSTTTRRPSLWERLIKTLIPR